MNYADIIRLKYKNYVLTKIGTGDVYEDIQWSAFNPQPNPIPKATLDADIASLLSQGITGAKGSIQYDELKELVAISQLPHNTSGLIKKVSEWQYTLDQSTYLTTINSSQVNSALGYTPYDSSNPSNYTTKSYVDTLFTTGIVWLPPVQLLNLVGGTATPPTSPLIGDAYIIYTGGNIGAWVGFNVGDLIQYQSGGWTQIVDVSSITVGMRFIIGAVTTTAAVGFAVGKDNYIAVVTGGVGGGGENITWDWSLANNNSAVFISQQSGQYYGKSFLYNSTDNAWYQFQSSNTYSSGNGLSLDGSTFNVNEGSGIKIANNKIGIDLYSTGGLILTEDGDNSSSTDGAQLSLAKVGTAGTYTKISVDVYGRITSGSNPTTLAGYNILDAASLDHSHGNATITTAGFMSASDKSKLDSLSSTTIKNMFAGTLSATSGTSTITPGTTAPLVTAGTELWNLVVTPQTTSSRFTIQCGMTVSGSSNSSTMTAAIFRNSTYIGSAIVRMDAANDVDGLNILINDLPNTTSAVTYSCRVGVTGGTWYVNRRSSEITYGGTNTGWTITEF